MSWLRSAVFAMLAGHAAMAQAGIERFYGHAYDLETGAYLYTEVHAQWIENGRWLGGTIGYYTPQGEKFAHKTLDFSADEFVPVFRMEDSRSGYMEAITDNRQAVTMERRETRQGKVEQKRIDKRTPMCADSGFHSCVRASFGELMAGRTLRFALAVPGSLDSFRFRARRVGETVFEGRKAVKILVEPDSLLRLLAGPLELVYEPEQRQLLEFRGISNVLDPDTGKPYQARIIFPAKPPADVPRLPPLGG